MGPSSSVYAESDAADSSTGSGSRPKAQGGGRSAGGAISNNRQREEDYNGVCHTDVVKCIVIADNGKIFTAGCVGVRWCGAMTRPCPGQGGSSPFSKQRPTTIALVAS